VKNALHEGFSGYESKEDLLVRFAGNKQVLHLGAVGCTEGTTAQKVAAAASSIHAFLSRISTCIGVDIDEEAVRALVTGRVFDNLIIADVEKLRRDDIPLQSIDVVVAGDVVEHLSNPGLMLDALRQMSEPSTRLLLTTPNALGLPIFVRYSMGKSVDGHDHTFSFNRFTLENLLKRHGWAVTDMYSCHQARAKELNAAPLFWIGRQLFRWIPRLGGTLFVVAAPQG
jgi:2-polyprenyl-3-methyl-5-hydroxy-6-metoxy-1,4-benzoquinol methylase